MIRFHSYVNTPIDAWTNRVVYLLQLHKNTAYRHRNPEPDGSSCQGLAVGDSVVSHLSYCKFVLITLLSLPVCHYLPYLIPLPLPICVLFIPTFLPVTSQQIIGGVSTLNNKSLKNCVVALLRAFTVPPR